MRTTKYSLAFMAATLLGLPGMSLAAQHSSGSHSNSSSGQKGQHSSSSHTSNYYGHSGYYGNAYSGAHVNPYHGGYYDHNWYHDGYYGHGYYPHGGYWGPGYGFLGGLPLFQYPWGYSRYNYGYGAPYYQGSYYYGPTDNYAAAPSAPMPETATGPIDESSNPNVVNVEIRVPANAELWVLGQKTNTTGEVRHLVSPSLQPGDTYTYEFRARWTDANGKAVEKSKKIDVKAGEWIGVDFNRA